MIKRGYKYRLYPIKEQERKMTLSFGCTRFVWNNLVHSFNDKSISDASFGTFRQQLTYKCDWYGKELVIADRFYPSSKTCSCCGQVKTLLKLSQRTYHCDMCGLVIDRDYNAALNLKNLAARVKAA